MIARVVYGKIRTDADAEQKAAAWQEAVKAHEGLPGFQGVYLLEPPEGESGVLMVSLWDNMEDAVAALHGRSLWTGLSGFSLIVAEPPRAQYYPVAGSWQG